MRALSVLSVAVTIFLFNGQGPGDEQDPEHPKIASSSEAFRQSMASSTDALSKAKFEDELQKPALGASSGQQFENLLGAIKAETPIKEISEGSPGIKYDVILQPGHYGRPPDPGPVGTSGELVSERALVAYVTEQIAEALREDNDTVLVVSADNYLRKGLTAKIFLAIHADGSVKPCSTGPSLGYKSESSLFAMHAIGWSLSAALGYRYADFSKDNYTVNEAKYYMFNQVKADRLTGLLEIGELTCPTSEKQMIASSRRVGLNVAHALDFIVRTKE